MEKNYDIKGIPVTANEYQMLEFVITNEEQQGWHPTKEDVEELVQSGRHPSKKLQNDMKEFNRNMDRDA